MHFNRYCTLIIDMVYLALLLLSYEMKLANQVQILDEIVCISLHVHALEKRICIAMLMKRFKM